MTSYFSTIPAEVYDAIGVAGFGLYVLNYSLLTFQRLGSATVTYFVLNGCAAAMVLIGLMSAFNLAAALIQVFWIAISTVAVLVRLRQRRQSLAGQIRLTGSRPPTRLRRVS